MSTRRPAEKPKIIRMQRADGPGARVQFHGAFWFPLNQENIERANPWGDNPPKNGLYLPDRTSSWYSNTIGPGDFPNLAAVAPSAHAATFDGIGVDFTTRLVVYRRGNKNSVVFDCIGPFHLRNSKWMNDGRYNRSFQIGSPSSPGPHYSVWNEYGIYSEAQIRWSSSNMHAWPTYCGCEVFARQDVFIRKNPILHQTSDYPNLAYGELIEIPNDYCYNSGGSRVPCYWSTENIGTVQNVLMTSYGLSDSEVSSVLQEDETKTREIVTAIESESPQMVVGSGIIDSVYGRSTSNINDPELLLPNIYIDAILGQYGYAFVKINSKTHIISLKKPGRELNLGSNYGGPSIDYSYEVRYGIIN